MIAGELCANVTTYKIERMASYLQYSSNSVLPLQYAWKAEALGTRMTGAQVTTPSNAVQTLTINSSGTKADAMVRQTVGVDAAAALALFEASFPLGNYTSTMNYTLFNGTTQTVTPVATLTAPFPTAPLITAPTLFLPLAASSAFTWSSFPGVNEDVISFSLYEGTISIELMQQLAAGDLSALDTFSVKALQPNLSPTTTGLTVEGLDPLLDHVAVLSFKDNHPLVLGVPTVAAGSFAQTVAYYPRTPGITYTDWLKLHFTTDEINAGLVIAPSADPDADSWVNFAEYAFGLDPKVSEISASETSLDTTTSELLVSYVRSRRVLDVSYSYEQLVTSGTWEPALVSPVEEVVPLDLFLERVTARWNLGASNLLVRVRAETP